MFYGVMKNILILLLDHKILNRILGWAINYFGNILENHQSPPYSRYFMTARLNLENHTASLFLRASAYSGVVEFRKELYPKWLHTRYFHDQMDESALHLKEKDS